MKVGIIGSGGREHAICNSLSKSDKIEEIYCFPGNAGTSKIAKNIIIDLKNFINLREMNRYCSEHNVAHQRLACMEATAVVLVFACTSSMMVAIPCSDSVGGLLV